VELQVELADDPPEAGSILREPVEELLARSDLDPGQAA